MESTPDDDLIGQLLADRYRVEALLGTGAMGAVYRAEHVHMKKLVALKVLHREMTHDPQVVSRFEREAVAAGRIEHPNVATAKDFGKLEDGSFYLVLEYVQGALLRVALRGGPLPPARAVAIAKQIADALGAAHDAGIVHRDLKPENVMLVPQAEGGDLVKVLDFGIAKISSGELEGQALTKVGAVFGTPEYMAPEQASGQVVDHRVDLYALGVMLYEMLAGRAPFEADDMIAVLTQQLVAEPAPLPAHVDRELAALVHKQLAKLPQDRSQSAAELGAALDALQRRFGPPSGVQHAAPVPSDAALTSNPTRVDGPSLGNARTEPPPPSAVGPATQRSGAVATVPAQAGSTPTALARGAQELRKTVRIAGTDVPAWVLVVVVFGLIAIGGVVLFTSAISGMRMARASATAQAKEGAAAGDEDAIAALERVKDPSAEQLVALASGRVVRGELGLAIATYRRAIAADAAMASRPEVLQNVRRIASDPVVWSDALDLAAQLMGAAGADLLYDVKLQAPEDSPARRRATMLLQSEAVQNAASPPLRLALSLAAAKKCPQFKELLTSAVVEADERSLAPLEKLTKKTGCGRRGRHDCYRCLRSDSPLEAALQRARTTPAPRLGAVAQ